jgi:ADP-heptose:LPS heptosyltransferase
MPIAAHDAPADAAPTRAAPAHAPPGPSAAAAGAPAPDTSPRARPGSLAARLRSVLIVRLSAVGDCVHVLPALDALRRGLGPRAKIGWLVEDRAASLIRGLPQVDRVHVVPRSKALTRAALRRPLEALTALGSLVREVRAERYDAALDLQSNLRSSVSALLSGARTRVGLARGYAKEGSHLLHTRGIAPRGGPRAHKVERYLDIMESIGIDTAGARPVIAIPEAAREKARAFFAARFPEGPPVVALHPGVSKFGAFKQWPSERFAAAADLLAARAGARSLVTWGPGERTLAEEVAARAGPAAGATVAPETGSLLELAALYERCAAVVGCDTGPIHLAAALGLRVIGLFGPKDPSIYAPWVAGRGRADVIWKGVHCSPCTLRWCGSVICMDEIRAPEVADAVERAIAEAAAGVGVRV